MLTASGCRIVYVSNFVNNFVNNVLIITGIFAVITLFAISSFSVSSLRGTQLDEFRQVMLYSVIVNALIYFVLGFALSKIFSKSKIGTWFPSK